jgi:phenylpropionate dioxygenase-like ring-hydroxylating dioxygenase large terminal subunit
MLEGFPYSSYPTGWFQFAWSAEIAPGEVKPLHYFGRELVCYRGEAGDLNLLDAFCLHMGAHLGHGGTVEGDDIRCPFHGWRWGSSGANCEIPYSSRLRFNLRLQSYPVEEVDGLALMWFSPSGAEPTWKPPLIEAHATLGDFFDIYPHCTRSDRVKVLPQLIVENTVDFPHLKWVHRWDEGEPELVDYEVVGHRFTATMRGDLKTPTGLAKMETTMNNYGVGLSVAPMTGLRPMIQAISAIPIDEDYSQVRMTMFVSAPAGVDKRVPDGLAQGIVRGQAREALEYHATSGDRHIWENMRYVARPPLTGEEMAPTKAIRKWASQFYEDAGNGRNTP